MGSIYPLQLVFLSSFSVLFLQVLLVRIFSHRFSYHFASLIIGIAIFGIVIGSLYVHVKKSLRLRTDDSFALLSFLLPVHFIISVVVPFDHARLLWDRSELTYLILLVLITIVPFFGYGFFIAICFKEFSLVSSRIYGADLLGASSGAFFAPYALDILKPEACLGILFTILSCSTFLFLRTREAFFVRFKFLVPVALSLLILSGNVRIPIAEYKSLSGVLKMSETRLLKTITSRDSRLDILENPYFRYAPGLSLQYSGVVPTGILVARDGEIWGVYMDEELAKKRDFFRFMPSFAPYVLKKNPENVLILGFSSNTEALLAQYQDAKNIFITEMDRSIKKFVEEFFGKNHIYSKFLIRENPRSFIKKAGVKMDTIVISRTRYFPSGNFGLEEDYETTVEAFVEYLRALKDDGVLYVQVFRVPPPRYELRLFYNLREALRKSSMWPMNRYVIIFSTWDTLSFLVKKNGYSLREVLKIEKFLKEMMFQPLYPSAIVKDRFIEGTSDQEVIKRVSTSEYSEFIREYIFDVRITTDERPFFNYFLKFSRISDLHRMTGKKLAYFLHEGMALPFLLLMLFALASLTIAPVLVKKEWKIQKPFEIVVYFSAIGFGFMFLEVFYVHRFIRIYTSPVDSFSTVLTSVLVGAGLGSIMSSYLRGRVLIISISAILPLLFIVCFPFPLKESLFFLFFNGLCMGLFFPSGMRILCGNNRELLPFVYAINGVASVVAPSLASIIALYFGLKILVTISILCYAISIFIIAQRVIRPAPHPFL